MSTFISKDELKNTPPSIEICKETEIEKIVFLIQQIEENVNKIKNRIENSMKIDTYLKIKLLQNDIQEIIDKTDDIYLSFYNNDSWDLSEEEINKININIETKEMYNKFFPLMILYKIMKTT